MKQIRLGRTGLMVTRTSFGALPLQRVDMAEAIRIVRRAYDGGVNYFDTANAYTDSEEKLGRALSGVRANVVISTKSMGADAASVTADIENSLRMLQTDYIDLFQFHNPAVLPDPNDERGVYAAARKAQQKGYIRHIGITNHRLHIARQSIESGAFETLQFPFSYLASDEEIALVKACKEADVGFIAMKGLAGGLLANAEACAAYMRQYDNVVPIWGVQRMCELEEFLSLEAREALPLTPALLALIERDRMELAGSFCRGCGYCLPCPAGIDIPQAARMSSFLRRSPREPYMTKAFYEKMHRIDDCIGCRACASRCPYGLDTPNLLKSALLDFERAYAACGER